MGFSGSKIPKKLIVFQNTKTGLIGTLTHLPFNTSKIGKKSEQILLQDQFYALQG